MNEIKDYWIVFTNTEFWHQRFLKKCFGHCYVIYKDQYDCWCALDPTRFQLRPLILPYTPDVDVPHVMANNFERFRLIKVTKRIDDKNFFKFGFNVLSCVSMVKFILNLKMRCYTPYKLYKKLFNLPYEDYGKYGISSISIL